eukprot:COSAG06_NODE_63467_length_262_cov_0.638037_2_plen_37_part_01
MIYATADAESTSFTRFPSRSNVALARAPLSNSSTSLL